MSLHRLYMGCLIGMIKTELRDQDGYKLHLRSSSTIDSISWAMSRQTMNSSLISLVPRSFVKGKKGERLCDLNSPPVGEACRNWPPSSSLKWSPLPPSLPPHKVQQPQAATSSCSKITSAANSTCHFFGGAPLPNQSPPLPQDSLGLGVGGGG